MGKLIKGISIVATFAFLFYFHQKAYERAVSNVVYIVTLKKRMRLDIQEK